MLKSLITRSVAIGAAIYGSTLLFAQKVLAQTYYSTSSSDLSSQEEAQLAVFLGAYAIIIIVFTLIAYVYYAICLMKLAEKLNIADKWMAWVPLLNLYLETKCAGISAWMMVLYFIPFANVFYMVYVQYKIAERRGFEPLIGLAILLPFVGFLVPAYLAFAKNPSGV